MYLVGDYSILCTDDRHRVLQVYSIIMILVYPLGIPTLYAVLLYRQRESLSRGTCDETLSSTAQLWAWYEPRFFYYEVVECIRRILLTGVTCWVYQGEAAQIVFTLIVTFVFLMVFEVCRPLKSRQDAWVYRWGEIVVYSSFFAALLYRVDVSDDREYSQQVFGWVVVLAHAGVVLGLIIQVCVGSLPVWSFSVFRLTQSSGANGSLI